MLVRKVAIVGKQTAEAEEWLVVFLQLWLFHTLSLSPPLTQALPTFLSYGLKSSKVPGGVARFEKVPLEGYTGSYQGYS